jgi:hypothetical protein
LGGVTACGCGGEHPEARCRCAGDDTQREGAAPALALPGSVLEGSVHSRRPSRVSYLPTGRDGRESDFAYALAQALGEPLLVIGDDFSQADVAVAAY